MKNKLLLTSMCLVSLLGLGACGGTGNGSKANIILTEPPVSGSVVVSEEIKDRELKKSEQLYIYTLGGTGYFACSYYSESWTNEGVELKNCLFGNSNVETFKDCSAYYTITEKYMSVEVKSKTSQERQVKYTISGYNLSYCLVTGEA